MALHIAPVTGFPVFGSDEPEIVLTCDCMSLANIQAVVSGDTTGSDKALITYSDAGVQLNNAAGVDWDGLTADHKTALSRGGTFTCWVETGWTTTPEYFCEVTPR